MVDLARALKLLIILFLMLLIVVSIGTVAIVYGNLRDTILDISQDEVRGIAGVAAGGIDGDILTRIAGGTGTREDFAEIRDHLGRVKGENPDIINAYTLRSSEKGLVYVVDAESGYSPDAPGNGELYPHPSAAAFRGFSLPVADGYPGGRDNPVLSAYAPVRDSSGLVAGVVGIDMNAAGTIDRTGFAGTVIYLVIVMAMSGIAAGAVGMDVIRTKAEEAVTGSAQVMREVFRSVYDGIILHDADGKIIDINDQAAGFFGTTRNDAPGLMILDILTAWSIDTSGLPGTWKDVMAGDTRFFGWKARNPHTGRELESEVYLRSLPYGDQRVIMVNIRDITERKIAEGAIQQANVKLNLLNSITRHDIFNQLTIILGYLTLMEEDPDNPEKEKRIATIKQAAETIRHLIAFTKDYQDIGVKTPGWQDVHRIVEQTAGTLGRTGITISDSLAGIEVYGDPLFEKVIYNLIGNALEHGGPSMDTISFSSRVEGQDLILLCEDNGTGIADEQKPLIFNRSFGTKTGMGLFLSREILAITGIAIEERGTYGKGARFEMRVPRWRRS